MIRTIFLLTVLLSLSLLQGYSEADTRNLPIQFFRNLEKGKQQTLVVYGTSLSATSEWPKQLESYLNSRYPNQVEFINTARSGKHSNWGRENFQGRVAEKKPDLVFLEFAANDSATKHSLSLDRSLENLDWMVRRLREQNPKIEIALQTMNPAWDAAEHPDQKFYATSRPQLSEYNDLYRQYARQRGLPLVDNYPDWEALAQSDPKRFEQWLPDGLHPTPVASLAVTWENVRDLLDEAQSLAKVKPAKAPLPTFANLAYGTHPRQVMDCWIPNSPKTTPAVLYIHGGGWVKFDKDEIYDYGLTRFLDTGIAVISINYRYTWQAQLNDVDPPIQWPLSDAARALQFVRYYADNWNIDPNKIALAGTSAGGCSSLWLSLSKDMADPTITDPIARSSTRVHCVAAYIAQTSLDPLQLKNWIPNARYAGHAFGFMDPKDLNTRDTRFNDFLSHRDELLPNIQKYSPIGLASPSAPPICLIYNNRPTENELPKDPTHSAIMGIKLKEVLDQNGTLSELHFTTSMEESRAKLVDFLITQLTREK